MGIKLHLKYSKVKELQNYTCVDNLKNTITKYIEPIYCRQRLGD